VSFSVVLFEQVSDYHSVLHMKLQHIPHYEDGDSAKLYNRLRQISDDEDEEEAEEEEKAEAMKRAQSNSM